MKFIRISLTLVILYTICGISLIHASSINPAINRVVLSQGERTYGSVHFTNTENVDVDVEITPYAYNPKTDDISEDTKYIFLKTDTDTIRVKAKTTFTVKYEIVPLSNLAEGTYFNVLALTPLIDSKDLNIKNSVSQLIILDVVNVNNQVKGITTTAYTSSIEVVKKGIPFLTPVVLKYSIKNNSNFLLVPEGRIDILNEKSTYKPTYVYINQEKENLYPGETLEKEFTVSNWHISDLIFKRYALGQVYNGIDNKPQEVQQEINSYIFEIIVFVISVFFLILLTKSLRDDLRKKKK